MTQFVFKALDQQDMVITQTASQFITLNGIKEYIGTHLVTFSGTGMMQNADRDAVIYHAQHVDDIVPTQ